MLTLSAKGPRLIVGHVGHDSANIWGRGDATRPYMRVRATDPQGQVSETVTSLPAEDAYTGVASIGGLEDSTAYKVDVSFLSEADKRLYAAHGQLPVESNPPAVQGEFETPPEPGQDEEFSMLVGSCNFHGWGPIRNNDGAAERVGKLAQETDLALHLGDNVYADKAPLSFTRDDFRNAYLNTWNDPGLQDVLTSQPNYMLADDHEIVNGYAIDGELTKFQRFLLWTRGHHGPKGAQYAEMAENAKQAFAEFQTSHGPSKPEGKTYYSFSRGQHQFFATDTRFERHNGKGQLMSQEQRQAMYDWLLEHRDEPKFILTAAPFITGTKDDESWSNPNFRREKDEVIDFLAQNKLDNVVFLAGDIHGSAHSEMTLTAPDGEDFTIHELVSSPINGSIMLARDSFIPEFSGVTASGTSYEVQLDESTAIGRGRIPTIRNSNVLKVDVDGNNISYEFHSTRRDNDSPMSSGSFLISDPE